MLCHYGNNNNYIDVTDKVFEHFEIENKIVLPSGPKNFNSFFGDPLPGVVKNLIIFLSDNNIITISENDLKLHIIDNNCILDILLHMTNK
jgi:hypothetical protein